MGTLLEELSGLQWITRVTLIKTISLSKLIGQVSRSRRGKISTSQRNIEMTRSSITQSRHLSVCREMPALQAKITRKIWVLGTFKVINPGLAQVLPDRRLHPLETISLIRITIRWIQISSSTAKTMTSSALLITIKLHQSCRERRIKVAEDAQLSSLQRFTSLS